MKVLRKIALSLAVLAGSPVLHADVKLADLFGDNMILQRDAKAAVWGYGDPGDTITLTLEDQKITAVVGSDRRWKAVFHGLKPGGSFMLTVSGKANTITVKNVAVGDIWVCGGQSNMEYPLRDQDEIAAANNPDLRCFNVGPSTSSKPETDLGGAWQVASPATVPGWSAVAYYFAKNLHRELGVPIGIFKCSWNGMFIEPFIPFDSFSPPFLSESMGLPSDLGKKVRARLQYDRDLPGICRKYVSDLKTWQEKYNRADTENKGFASKWADPDLDTKDWVSTTTPGDWSKLAPTGGIVWVRKIVQLPPEAVGKDFRLGPEAILDSDITYFNGEKIGALRAEQRSGLRTRPSLLLPGRLVKSGANVIAIRVVSQQAQNPIFGDARQLGLPVADPRTIPNEWLAKVERGFAPLPPDALATMPALPTLDPLPLPTVIYNAMINPLTSYGIKGALWYQGEANAGNPWAYRTYLPLLIRGWRQHWDIGDFPFYIVQLSTYQDPPKTPDGGDVHWPELREAQLWAWQMVPHTGMVVTVDIGSGGDVHPRDKKDVGYRLALSALANTYDRKIEASGPIYNSMTVEGDKIRLKFTHLGGGLVAKNGPLKQFVICGEDKKWAWANAVIDGDTVMVSSPDVAAPVAVRYAWSSNPQGCNLYNQAGLPASPFRTDGWPMGMEGQW